MLIKGQLVKFDATGLGHWVVATYAGPLAVSARFPEGGHKVQVRPGKFSNIRQTPIACDSDQMRVVG
jgi:hypothetical protein